jgi:disulfide bond formation protein DsbB
MIVNIFAYLVLFAQIFIVFFVLTFLLRKLDKQNKFANSFFKLISDNFLQLSFFVVLFAMFGSLFFSEIAHFVPCKLCWYQRICMYPQVLLLGIANLKNDYGIKKYILPLSVIGTVIAIYHYVLQMSPFPLPCSDEIANCALKQVSYFGYITIPLMSLTAFVLVILFMTSAKSKKKS